MPAVMPATQAGRLNFSLTRPATMPTTPGCQPSAAISSTAWPALTCASAIAIAVPSISPSTSCRRLFTSSSFSAMARASIASSESNNRKPKSASAMRPEALMRGPSMKPSVCALGISFCPATSSKAASPIRPRLPSTFKPCVTKARLNPVSGMTSHTVASATISSNASKSGSFRRVNQPARRSTRRLAVAARNATAAAQICRKPEGQSSRLGLTTASTAGSAPSAL